VSFNFEAGEIATPAPAESTPDDLIGEDDGPPEALLHMLMEIDINAKLLVFGDLTAGHEGAG
jgi:hypothetical protein